MSSLSFTVRSGGGLLRVLQTRCHVAVAFDPATAAQPFPPFSEFQAIWDTGATNSVITQQVVNSVGLKPTGMTQVHGFNSAGLAETFLVNIGLPNGVAVTQVPVTKGTLGGGVDILIGMDIITTGDFVITNRGGTTVFSFSYPSRRFIDFVQEDGTAANANRPGFRGFNPPPPKHVGKKGKRR